MAHEGSMNLHLKGLLSWMVQGCNYSWVGGDWREHHRSVHDRQE